MKIFLASFLLICCSSKLFSQLKQFDKLEMLYDQQHYKLVNKKAKKLLDNPRYDFSLIPTYYICLTNFQLSQDANWRKRNPNALVEANTSFKKIKKSSDGLKIMHAHFYELVALKRDLLNWLEDLKKENNKQLFALVQEIINQSFNDVPDIENEHTISKTEITFDDKNSTESSGLKSIRETMMTSALQYIGTPYAFSGDTPKGFDCSGFTSFIHNRANLVIPRNAREQYEKCTKIKENKVAKGDLIFFTNGSYVSHVGIVASNRGEPIVFIHSSSTKGIIITELSKSIYWLKRLVGYGTYVSEE